MGDLGEDLGGTGDLWGGCRRLGGIRVVSEGVWGPIGPLRREEFGHLGGVGMSPRVCGAHPSIPTPSPQAAAVGPARGRDPGAGTGAPGAAPAHLQLLRPQTPPPAPSGVTPDPQLPPRTDPGPSCWFVNKDLGPPRLLRLLFLE